jgi:hypothetical protein
MRQEVQHITMNLSLLLIVGSIFLYMKDSRKSASFVAPHHQQKCGPADLFFAGMIHRVMKLPATEPMQSMSSEKSSSTRSSISGRDRRRQSAFGAWLKKISSRFIARRMLPSLCLMPPRPLHAEARYNIHIRRHPDHCCT